MSKSHVHFAHLCQYGLSNFDMLPGYYGVSIVSILYIICHAVYHDRIVCFISLPLQAHS